MADETTVDTTTGAAETAVPSVQIDPAEYERLQQFHQNYAGYVSASEPFANTITKIIQDPDYRNLVESAAKAREALAPVDDTPEYVKGIQSDLKTVKDEIDREKAERQQQQTMMAAQNRMLEISQRYPQVAENNWEIANKLATSFKNRQNVPMDVYLDAVEALGATLPAPTPEAKTPPRSTRADAGVPAVTPANSEVYANNKERGKAIDKKISALLKNVK